MNGYVQDERYTAGAGRAGAVPLKLARRSNAGAVAEERLVSVLHGVKNSLFVFQQAKVLGGLS